MTANLLLYALSFLGLWYGSGIIVDSIKALARKIRIPPFAFSFFVLGFLTSIPEISVGLNALAENRPEVYIGNLLGGVIVIFLLIIPLMAVLSGGIHVKRHLGDRDLLITLGIIAVPALFAIDGTITNQEALILLGLYVTLFYIIRVKRGVLDRVEHMMVNEDWRHSMLIKLLAGGGLVFATSRFIVDQTISFSDSYGWSTLTLSLIVLGVGTNLPELSLALRSLTNKAEDIALGDYLGSAATNTFFFGIFTLIHSGTVITGQNFVVTFIITISALLAFYVLNKGRKQLTWREGLLLLGGYALFVLYETRLLLG